MKNLRCMILMLVVLIAMPMVAQTKKKATTVRRPTTGAKRTVQSTTASKPKLIDLGLPSGTKWADRNLGATSVTSFGSYYAFGETLPKQTFSKSNYKGNATYPNIASTENDAATKKYGKGWSVPTKKQFEELLDNCEKSNAFVNGIMVVKLTGPNGNSIYMPYPSGRTMMKASTADNTKQLNDMWYNGTFSNTTYQNVKLVAKNTHTIKDGLIFYYSADKKVVLLIGMYSKEKQISDEVNIVKFQLDEDEKNVLAVFGMPIRPVFTPARNNDTNSEEDDGTINLIDD